FRIDTNKTLVLKRNPPVPVTIRPYTSGRTNHQGGVDLQSETAVRLPGEGTPSQMLIENEYVSIWICDKTLRQNRRRPNFDERVCLALASENSRRTTYPKVSALIFEESCDGFILQCGAKCHTSPTTGAKYREPSPP